MQLQGDRAVVQLSLLCIVGELRRQLAVDEELKSISLGDDADIVPIARVDVCGGQCFFYLAVMRCFISIDDQSCTTQTWVFLASGEVKVPRPKNVGTDSDVTEVGMISLERAFAGRVRLGADFDPRVAIGEQSVAEY